MPDRLLLPMLLALALVACGGQAGHSGPEPSIAWDASGLHVQGVHGPAVVYQQAPAGESGWQLQSGELGALHLEYSGDTITARVDADLTGSDTIIVHRDGELLVPDRAWVDVRGETVAYACVLDCEGD